MSVCCLIHVAFCDFAVFNLLHTACCSRHLYLDVIFVISLHFHFTISSNTSMHRQLRSSGSSNYTVSRTRTKLGDRAFSVAGPVIWNSIPESIRSVDNVHTFKRLLKTHFFNQLNWFYVTSFSCYFNCFMLLCIA